MSLCVQGEANLNKDDTAINSAEPELVTADRHI